jgi:hypothetical protein
MSRSRPSDRRTVEPTAPDPDFEVPEPGRTAPYGTSFVLQAVIEIQRSVADLSAKTDRLIKDVDKHGDRIDAVRHQISFVKGALWVIGSLVVLISAAIAIYLRLLVT